MEVSAGSFEASLAPGAATQSATQARRTAEQAAQSMLRAWGRPDLTPHSWWGTLRPLLSAQGQQDLAHTDPTRIPDLSLTGRARLVDQAHSMWAHVQIPTNRGVFGIELTRPTPTAAWLVDRIDFPAGVR